MKKIDSLVTTKHYDWALLNNRDIRDKYVLELRNRFETLQEKTEKGTPNDEDGIGFGKYGPTTSLLLLLLLDPL